MMQKVLVPMEKLNPTALEQGLPTGRGWQCCVRGFPRKDIESLKFNREKQFSSDLLGFKQVEGTLSPCCNVKLTYLGKNLSAA